MPEDNAAPTIESRVHELLMDQLGVVREQLSPGVLLVDDLGCDSLDIVELVMFAEEEFGIELLDSDIDQVRTVGDAVALVKGSIR